MRPVVNGLARKYEGRYDIRVVNPSAGNRQAVGALTRKYRIQYVPTFVFVHSDGKLSATVVGVVPAARIEKELAKLR
jgi:thioredoxin-related protein